MAEHKWNKTVRKELVEKLTDFFGSIGAFWYVRDAYCGQAIIQGAEQLAENIVDAADANEKLQAWLLKTGEASTWGKVLIATGGIVIPILAHHSERVSNELPTLIGMEPAPEREKLADERSEPQTVEPEPATGREGEPVQSIGLADIIDLDSDAEPEPDDNVIFPNENGPIRINETPTSNVPGEQLDSWPE